MSEDNKFNHIESFYDLVFYLRNNERIHGIKWDSFQVNLILDDNITIVCIKMIPDNKFNVITSVFDLSTIPEGDFNPDVIHDNKKSLIKYLRKLDKKLDINQCPNCKTKFKP